MPSRNNPEEEFHRLYNEMVRRRMKREAAYKAAYEKLTEGVRAMWEYYDESRRAEIIEEPALLLDPSYVLRERQICFDALVLELTHPSYTESDLWVMHEALGIIQTYPTD